MSNDDYYKMIFILKLFYSNLKLFFFIRNCNMKLIFIILISLVIVNVYSSIHNAFVEELAALILSLFDKNGQRLNYEFNINKNESEREKKKVTH